MEYFSVVQSIIRAGLSGDREAVVKQAARLRGRLERAGAKKEAETIGRLLTANTENKELAPSRIEVSRTLIAGETLTQDVNPPIDRETGARLCSILFPPDIEMPRPIYDERVNETIEGVIAEWSHAGRLKDFGVEPTRSLLIFGPPGSGKTLTAQYIAERMGLPLVVARIDGLISSFLGTTARNIANFFDFANRYSCILLLDEFDALAKLRDDPQEVGEIKRVVNTLLQNLDARRDFGVTIAITNHDRLLDPAVWRRFETQVHIAAPDGSARANLIERFLHPIEPEDCVVRVFSYCLDGQSGADLRRICDSVKRAVALNGFEQDGPGLFRVLASVLSRLPFHDHRPAELLARELDWFVSYAANDDVLGLKQVELAQATGYGQSTISKLKRERPYLAGAEVTHA